jgi:hypothetical protein
VQSANWGRVGGYGGREGRGEVNVQYPIINVQRPSSEARAERGWEVGRLKDCEVGRLRGWEVGSRDQRSEVRGPGSGSLSISGSLSESKSKFLCAGPFRGVLVLVIDVCTLAQPLQGCSRGGSDTQGSTSSATLGFDMQPRRGCLCRSMPGGFPPDSSGQYARLSGQGDYGILCRCVCGKTPEFRPRK